MIFLSHSDCQYKLYIFRCSCKYSGWPLHVRTHIPVFQIRKYSNRPQQVSRFFWCCHILLKCLVPVSATLQVQLRCICLEAADHCIGACSPASMWNKQPRACLLALPNPDCCRHSACKVSLFPFLSWIPHVGTKTQELTHPLMPSQTQQQGAGLKLG